VLQRAIANDGKLPPEVLAIQGVSGRSVLAAPQLYHGAFRALPIQPVSAAALKTYGTTMPFVIIPQRHEKFGLG
jgi:hypothetical protein